MSLQSSATNSATPTGVSYLSRTTGLPADAFTITLWSKANQPGAINIEQNLINLIGPVNHYLGLFGDTSNPSHYSYYSFDTGGEVEVDIDTTGIGPWVYNVVTWSGAVTHTLTIHRRLEGETSLTTVGTRSNWTEALAQLYLMCGDVLTRDCIRTGGAITAVKIWSIANSVAESLAESGSRSPVKTSGLYAYYGCALGSTIGADESGAGNNATVVGSGLSLSSAEPIMAVSERVESAAMRQLRVNANYRM